MKDSKLEEMKHDYQNIPIPKELKDRVTRSVEAAKEELHSPAMKTVTFKKLAFRTLGTAAAILLLITAMANSGASISYAMEQIPVLGSIARIVTFREYSYLQNNMEAKVKVPSVSIEHPDGTPQEEASKELNQQIEAYTSQIIAAFEADVAASGEEGHESINLDYEVVTDNDRLFTLRFDETIVMASGTHFVNIYNLDKTTGSLITLKDLFLEGSDYITPISDSIKEQMKAQMAADENIFYYYQSETPEWDFNEIDPQEDFYLSENGTLTLVFDEYQVAPGYMGSVEFEIPTQVIADIVKDGYVKQ